jgi:hypothetical protein
LPEAYLVSVVFLQLTGYFHPGRLCFSGFMGDVIELGDSLIMTVAWTSWNHPKYMTHV